MSDEQQKVAYVDLLEAARKTDDEIASVGATLKNFGHTFVSVGRSLIEQMSGENIPFDRESFDVAARRVGDLIEQYNAAVRTREDQETQLRRFSYHRK